jgi:hypothetical protein
VRREEGPTVKSDYLLDSRKKKPLEGLITCSSFVFAGCGTDWAVSPLSRLVTVAYLFIGIPIMYLYLMSTGSLMARAICVSIRALMCKRAALNSTNMSSRRSSTSLQGTPPPHKEQAPAGGGHHHPPRRSNSYHAGASSEKLALTKRSTWQTRSSLAAQHRSSIPIHTTINTLHFSNSNGSVNTLQMNIADLPRPNVAPPIICSLILVSVYILSGAAVIANAQGWAYCDALYFCFVSLFTIGLGGIRPNEPNLWLCALYLLIGVTLLSTCCHILHQEVTLSLRRYRNVMKRNRLLMAELEAAKTSESSAS